MGEVMAAEAAGVAVVADHSAAGCYFTIHHFLCSSQYLK